MVRDDSRKPSKLTSLILALILVAGATVVAWQFFGDRFPEAVWERWFAAKKQAKGTASQADVYYCPMHKDYQTDKPGNCPICSMKLVKLEKSEAAKTSSKGETAPVKAKEMSGMALPSQPTPPQENTIFIAPQQQQLIGVQTVPATVQHLVKEIRTVGKIAYDETKVTHIHTKINGWIEQVFVDFVGKFVKKGDPLFTIYSPDLVATQEEYLLALRARRDLGTSSFERVASGAQSLVEASRRRLRLWDVSDEEIARLEKEGKAQREVTIYSPVSGLVTERAAYHHGRYVTPELDLYTIVDLSTVWALGEIYEYELSLVRQGQSVAVELPYGQTTRPIRGTVTYIYPYLNSTTRTAQIRMEFPNPGFQLKPEMFVNIKLRIDLGRELSVPEDAVLNTGTQQYVFVDKGNGYFEPREVKLGEQTDGHYVIRQGLKPGERVATAANFILDSESRLKGAFANMGLPHLDSQLGSSAASELQIQLHTEPEPAKVGNNIVRVRITDTKSAPILNASVRVEISMPAMGAMPPMNSDARLTSQGNGVYSGVLNIPMAWTWQASVTVERDGKRLGSAQFGIVAR